MQKGHVLHFECQKCQKPIHFSIFELEKVHHLLKCSHCAQAYDFDDEFLKRHLNKFEKLCKQILESEEILSSTHVGISIGDRHVKVPYRLLLTRLNTVLELSMGNVSIPIEFRLEPAQDFLKLKEKPS